ncbi:MAG: aspartate/glutamate racemase family protein [Euryarchaeota archaeon]|nr:aspartate/glutamate racemase family protein [Euryarchaeota archaeon]
MGPLATVELERRIVLYNKRAKRDQDHVPMIVVNDPRVPDRTSYIKGTGPDPRPKIIEGLKKLETAGAEIVFIPCNTAHAFYEDLVKNTRLPVYHMPYRALEEAIKIGKRIGLLATLGTYMADVYRKISKKISENLEVVYPDRDTMNSVMEVIYKGVKGAKGVHNDDIKKIVKRLNNVDVIILGCTELSLLKDMFRLYTEVVDPLDVAAHDAIRFSYREVSEKDIIPSSL